MNKIDKTDKIDIRSLSYEELTKLILNLGEKKFRTTQVYDFLHKRLVSSFSEMNNVPKGLLEKLEEVSYIPKVTLIKEQVSEDTTTKYLFEVNGSYIETVMMTYKHGVSLCVSTQAGCKMGCTFCASTIGGFIKNLTAGEMLGQVYEVQKRIDKRISHIVLMGSGEPLDNYNNTLKFIEQITCDKGLNLSARHVTLSTCGLVDRMNELSKLSLQINLAVSLHAPNDEIRDTIMPINKKYGVDEVIKSAKAYANHTKRRVTYEYALISSVNDSTRNANELGKKLMGSLCHVNLIPVNDVVEKDYKKSDKTTIQDFANILKSLGVETTIRRENGSDINASCGQLRNEIINKEL